MQLHFKKLPVPFAKPLTELPSEIGPWVQVSIDETLPHDFQEALGTEMYVLRDYVDTRVAGDALAAFKGVDSPSERKHLAGRLQLERPGAVVNIGLTYYTGMVDTVAHVPERCYIADGYEPTKTDDFSWSALQGRPSSQAGGAKVRYIVFEDTTAGRMSIKRNVAYLFHCNGLYTSDSIDVRRNLANLFEKHGYYMKVEMQTLNLSVEESARVMNDFLTHALPEVEKSLPDWNKLKSAR
jgi:hypothetical protein